MGRIVKLLALLPLAMAAEAAAAQVPWCNAGTEPSDAAWVRLTDYEVLTLDVGQIGRAKHMLRNRTVIELSPSDAAGLLGTASVVLRGPLFLIRAGIILPPGKSPNEVNEEIATPEFLEVSWSQRYRSVALNSISFVRGAPRPYDVPLILRSTVRPRHAYMACTSTN